MTIIKSALSLFIPSALIICSNLFFSSCKKDPCAGITCKAVVGTTSVVSGTPTENGSACNCVCYSGYEGLNCEIETRTKFSGVYTYSETCSPSGANSYMVGIDTSSAGVNKIKIGNLYNSGLNVIATVSGTTLTIASQTFGTPFTISGSGSISSNTLSLTYKVTDGTITDNCSGTGTK